MSTWIFIAVGVGLFASLPLIGIAMGARGLRRLTLGPSLVVPIDTEEVHDVSRWELYAPWIEELERSGFEPMGWMRLRATTAASSEPVLAFALRDVDRGDTWAVIEPADLVSRALPVLLTLHSPLPEGGWLESTVGRGFTSLPPLDSLEINDPLVDSPRELFARHREWLVPREPEPRPMEISEFAAAFQAAMDRQLAERVRIGQLTPTGEPERWHCTVRTALAWARRQSKAQPAYLRHVTKLAAQQGSRPPIPLIEEVRAFERYESLWRGRPRSKVWLAVLLVTGVLAVVSFAQLLDWQGALAIGVALLVHELGHFLAMRAFGYRDSQVFFIPFLGAATTGTKPEATVAQEMVVLLAGPVPGLLLALLLVVVLPLLGVAEGFGEELITMLVVINLLNLLPIFPLDGGRIVHRLIAAGRPFVDLSFRLLAVGIFLLAAVTLADGITVFLAIFVAIGIPSGYQLAKLEQRSRALEAPEGDDADRVRLLRVFRALREAADHGGRATRTVLVARQLRDRLVNEPASVRAAMLWLAIYGGTTFGGVLVLGAVAVSTSLLIDPPDLLLATDLRPFDCDAPPDVRGQIAVYECVLDDPDALRALDDELGWYGMSAVPFCSAGPWGRARAPSEAARNARRTAALVMESRQGRATGAEPLDLGSVLGSSDGLEERLAPYAGEPWYDAEVAARVQSWLEGYDSADAAVLRERLHCQEGEGFLGGGVLVQHAVRGNALRIVVHDDLPGVGELLCARRCSSITRRAVEL